MASHEHTSESKFLGFDALHEEQRDWILRHVFYRLALGPCAPEAVDAFRSILEQASNKTALELFRESGLTKSRNSSSTLTCDDAEPHHEVELAKGHTQETARMTLNLWIKVVNAWVKTGLAVRERLDARTEEEKERYEELVKEFVKEPW